MSSVVFLCNKDLENHYMIFHYSVA